MLLHSFFRRATLTALLLLGCQTVFAEDAAVSNKIQLKLEVTDAETEMLGITKKSLESLVTEKLADNMIGVTDDAKAPSLLVRFKSVQAAHVIASFVQVAFFEEAELLRGKSRIQAMTWSQATLLTSSKDDFVSETTKTIDAMIVSFVQDYKKAFHVVLPTPAAAPSPSQTQVIAPTVIPEQAQ